jgi:hypothetical protein
LGSATFQTNAIDFIRIAANKQRTAEMIQAAGVRVPCDVDAIGRIEHALASGSREGKGRPKKSAGRAGRGPDQIDEAVTFRAEDGQSRDLALREAKRQ